jgi:hypothetical protein
VAHPGLHVGGRELPNGQRPEGVAEIVKPQGAQTSGLLDLLVSPVRAGLSLRRVVTTPRTRSAPI